MTTNHDLDRLIDDVARGMTNPQDAVDLRARVVAQLKEQRRPVPWMWRLAPVGVLALVAFVFSTWQFGHATITSPVPATSLLNANGAPPPFARTAALADSLSSGGSSIHANGAPPPFARPAALANSLSSGGSSIHALRPKSTTELPSAEELAWRARSVRSLEPVNALAIAPIQPEALEIRPLETKAIVVPDLGADINRD